MHQEINMKQHLKFLTNLNNKDQVFVRKLNKMKVDVKKELQIYKNQRQML